MCVNFPSVQNNTTSHSKMKYSRSLAPLRISPFDACVYFSLAHQAICIPQLNASIAFIVVLLRTLFMNVLKPIIVLNTGRCLCVASIPQNEHIPTAVLYEHCRSTIQIPLRLAYYPENMSNMFAHTPANAPSNIRTCMCSRLWV